MLVIGATICNFMKQLHVVQSIIINTKRKWGFYDKKCW